MKKLLKINTGKAIKICKRKQGIINYKDNRLLKFKF